MTHTTETTPNAEKIAAGLSVGDRVRVRATEISGAAAVPKFSQQALFRLVQIGLADPVQRDGRGELLVVQLSPLGLAVREILRREA